MPPRYAFRLEDLRAFHLVRASCHACAHKAVIPNAALLQGRPGLDLFLEENMTYADRLSRAGVPVELHMYPRAYHGFYRATNARVTKQAEHDNREALRRFLHG